MTTKAATALKNLTTSNVADNDADDAPVKVNALKAEAEAMIAEGKGNPFKDFRSDDKKMINPYLLEIREGWNIRFENDSNRTAIIELAESIAEIGVKNPLVVNLNKETGQYWVEDGHRRYRATRYAIEVLGAQVKAIPVILGDKTADEANRVFSQFVRNSGKNLEPLEMAALISRMIGFGWSEEEIYKKSGYGRQRFDQLLELSSLDPKLKDFIAKGTASELMVTNVLKANNHNVEATVQSIHAAQEVRKDIIEQREGVRPEGDVKVKPSDLDKAIEKGTAPAPVVTPRKPRNGKSAATPATPEAPKADGEASETKPTADGKMTDSEFGKLAKGIFKSVGIDIYNRDGTPVEFSGKVPEDVWMKIVKHCDL